MALSVYTAQPDGTQRVSLDSLGDVAGLTFSNATPGGDTACSLSLSVPVGANPPGLGTGRILTTYDGPCPVWSGLLADPQRGAPWKISAQGLSSLANNYLALDATGNLTRDPNVAIDAAIARGLPWTRNTTLTLPTPSVVVNDAYLGSLLDAITLAAGLHWQVDSYGAVTMVAQPTTPTWVLTSTNTPGGRTLDNSATDVYVRYLPAVSVALPGGGSTIVAGPPTSTPAPSNPPTTAPRPYGRKEAVYDSTPGGPVTLSAAQGFGNGALAKIQPPASFSGAVTVLPGDQITLGGQPVRLSTVRAGTVVKMVGIQPDPVYGEQTFSTSVQIVIGQWDYAATTGVATLTPLGGAKRDFASLLQSLASNAVPVAQPRPWT
jgi:hypothetical protein